MLGDGPEGVGADASLRTAPQAAPQADHPTGELPKSKSALIARIAIRSTLWVSVGTYLTIAVGFLSNLVLTRLLSPEIFGFFSMANFWTGALSLRTKAGLTYAAIQSSDLDGDLLGTYFVLDLAAILGSTLIIIVIAVLSPLIGYEQQVVLAMIVLTLAEGITVVTSPLGMALQKELQVSRVALAGLASSVVSYSVAIGLAISGAGIWSLLAVNSVGAVIGIGTTYWICRQRLPDVAHLRWRFNPDRARQLLRLGIPTGLSLTTLSAIITQFDNFLIGTFVGYATLGFYDRAYRIASWSNILTATIVYYIGFVTFAKVQTDLPRLTHAVRLTLWVLTIIVLPLGLVFFFGATDLVRVLYGAKWGESALYLRLLVVYTITSPFSGVGFWLAVALGHRRIPILFTATQLIVLVIFATPLTLWFGVVGTIAGVAVSMVTAFVMSAYYISRQVSLSFKSEVGIPLAAVGISILTLTALSNLAVWSNLQPVARVLLVITTGPGTFALLLFALRPTETIERIRYLRRTWSTRG